MRDYRKEFPVEKMCKVFKVSRSGFYRNLRAPLSSRDNENRMLLFEIRRVHEKSKASYGSPRITKELNEAGFKVSRPRVARLMQKAGIKAVHKRKYKVTTDSKHKYPVAENKLNRNFTTQAKGQVWVSDITYVKTMTGWLYLTIILDLFDRKVVGWSMSSTMKAKHTTIAAWKMAIINRMPAEDLIFHSDRGVQYACYAFTNVLDKYPFGNIKKSMSRKGNCWDNAVAESFFKTIKTELIYRNRYANKHLACISIFEWIETWYNRNRRHAALNNLTIEEFEILNQFKNVA